MPQRTSRTAPAPMRGSPRAARCAHLTDLTAYTSALRGCVVRGRTSSRESMDARVAGCRGTMTWYSVSCFSCVHTEYINFVPSMCRFAPRRRDRFKGKLNMRGDTRAQFAFKGLARYASSACNVLTCASCPVRLAVTRDGLRRPPSHNSRLRGSQEILSLPF